MLDSYVALSPERRIAQWEDERQVMRSIDSRIMWHVAPPAMLGNARTNLPAKLRVFVHTLGLLSADREMLAKLLRSITSVHTDYGVESMLPRVAVCPLDDILPYMHARCNPSAAATDNPELFIQDTVQEACQDDPNLFLVQEVEESSNPGPNIDDCDLTRSLQGPDLNHVIHNITSGLGDVMAMYKSFLIGLKRVCRLLSGKESKQQLLETCFSSGFAVGFREEVAAFQCKVHEKRWNTIAHAVRCLRVLEPALRTCWDIHTFLRGRAVPLPKEDRGGDEHGVHLQGADEALVSDHWWSCLAVMLEIAEVQASATDYVNGCECHSHLLEEEEAGADVKAAWRQCPLRGRRCAQLAAGDFYQVLQRLFDCGATRLELLLARSLSVEQVKEIVSDFEAAKQYMLATYILKLSFWGEAPHALVALGHTDAHVRCKFLRKCLDSANTHPRIVDLKHHSDECLSFLESGGHWEGNFPYLSQLAAELRLMWSSAWRVEGQHARTKRGVTHASNHGPAYVSLCHRLPELRAFLKRNPDGFPRLADIFAGLSHRSNVAKRLGLSLEHAEEAGWLKGRISNKSTALIYHDDPYTKYTLDLPSKITFQDVTEHSLAIAPVPAEAGEASLADLSRQIRRFHAVEAVKALVQPKMYFSMPLNQKGLFTLRALIAPASSDAQVTSGHLCWEPSDQLALSWPTMPVDEAVSVQQHLRGGGNVLTKEVLYWSVVLSNPASFHRTKVQNAASFNGVWIVQLHRILRMDPASNEAVVSLKAALPASVTELESSGLAMYVNNFSLEDLQELRVWTPGEGLRYSFDIQLMSKVPPELHAWVPKLLQSMMQEQQGLAVTHDMDRELLEVLDVLVGEGVVEGPPWRLTDVAQQRVEHCVSLSNHQRLLRRHDGDLHEASTFQLILEMDAQGWTHEVLSKQEYKDLKRAKAEYKHGEQKRWCSCETCSVANRYYLLALLLLGAEQPVPHVGKPELYMQMLGLGPEATRRARTAVPRFQHTDENAGFLDFEDVPKPPPPKRRRRVTGKQPGSPLGEVQGPEVHEDNEQEEEDAAIDAALAQLASPSGSGTESETAAAQDDSSTSGSSSSSSSSSSDSSSDSPPQPAGARDDAPADLPEPPRPARARRKDVSYQWAGHTFTPKGPADRPNHWQVTCCYPAHNVNKKCTKTRSCRYGGSEEVQRMLKWWVLLGRDAATAEEHAELFQDTVLPSYNINTMPSLSDLEGMAAANT